LPLGGGGELCLILGELELERGFHAADSTGASNAPKQFSLVHLTRL
jgi:hypothetical protein